MRRRTSPLPRAVRALDSWSRRSGLFRLAESGPWQVKQRSERIGRTSRLYSTTGVAARASAAPVRRAMAVAARIGSLRPVQFQPERAVELEEPLRLFALGRFAEGPTVVAGPLHQGEQLAVGIPAD